MSSETDRIEKRITLRAPRARVWRALTDPKEFGAWFGVGPIEGTFSPGAHLRGPVTHPGYTHMTWAITVESMESERSMSWSWHPGSPNADHDYEAEPATTVTFTLEDTPEGTALTVVESGFDKLPPGRREEAYRGNVGGWDAQALAIEKYVSR